MDCTHRQTSSVRTTNVVSSPSRCANPLNPPPGATAGRWVRRIRSRWTRCTRTNHVGPPTWPDGVRPPKAAMRPRRIRCMSPGGSGAVADRDLRSLGPEPRPGLVHGSVHVEGLGRAGGRRVARFWESRSGSSASRSSPFPSETTMSRGRDKLTDCAHGCPSRGRHLRALSPFLRPTTSRR